MALQFKYHPVNAQGQQTGFLAKKGLVDEQSITLDGSQIPIGAIVDVDVRGKMLVFSVFTGGQQPVPIVLQTDKAGAVKQELGRLRSALWADAHKKQLEEKGIGHTFREAVCPVCSSVIDLTNVDESPQVDCQFCHTISMIADRNDGEFDPKSVSETGYRICDECGMYSKPRQFTIFYFYFLIAVYGWNHRTTWRCPGCMRGDAWKMLFGNALFVLGVPVALWQLFRSYGGTDIGGRFPGLDKANTLARKGDLDRAVAAYRTILEKQPVAAGVKFNIGLALLQQQQRADQAARMFEFALADCANYAPALNALAACYQNLGETEKLEKLKKRFEAEEAGEKVAT
jgi:tetratricopeptide (TPR) repeat protein